MAKIAGVLGKKADQARYAVLAGALAAEFNRRFRRVDANGIYYGSDSETSNAMALDVSRRFLVPTLLSHSRKVERRAVLEGFAAGAFPVLVANQVLDEGVDVPAATTSSPPPSTIQRALSVGTRRRSPAGAGRNGSRARV